MNFKKTWFGYLNFILASIFISASVIILVFSNLQYEMKDFLKNPSSDIISSHLNIPFWLALLIGIIFLCFFTAFYVLIRKFREYLCKKKGFFDTEVSSERFGGVMSLLIFCAGLFLRAKAIIDKNSFSMDIKSTVDSLNIQALFDKNNGLSFSSFNDFYDSIIAIVYKFTGIKTDVYMWVNFVLHIVLILLIYLVIMHLYNATVAIIPMLFTCLYPENIKLVVKGGYENIERILILLVFLLAILIVSLFKKSDSYRTSSLIFTFIFEAVFLIGLPLLIKGEIKSFPIFNFEINKRLYDFILFENWDFFCIGIFILLLFASISFFFTDRDKLSTVFPLWITVMIFYVFSNSEWATPYFAAICTAVFAGVGLDELVTSKILVNKEKEIVKAVKQQTQEIVISKPKTKEITVSSGENTVLNSEQIDKENSDISLSTQAIEEKNMSNEVNDSSIDLTSLDQPIATADSSFELTNELADENVEGTPKVELFESPLPLPKKHKKKEISYKFEPSSDRMNFDVDITDDDDFDV